MLIENSKKKIIGSRISTGPYNLFIPEILNLSNNKQSSYICVANVHMLIEGHNSRQFQQIINEADMVTPDGMPLAVGLKLLYGSHQDRVAGMDLLPDLLLEAEKQRLKVFFYGGTEQMQQATQDHVRRHYPSLLSTGFHSPPFRPLTNDEESEIIEKINATGTNLVFVALGCPKQEKWMASMKGRIHACMIGIGGALPVMVGMQSRAPEWMQRNSLEWLYRLYQEPRRLWKRYFITNSLFILLFVREYISVKLFNKAL